jgi:hypothetical protein
MIAVAKKIARHFTGILDIGANRRWNLRRGPVRAPTDRSR